MIHISKTKSGKFIVVTLGNNGELLSSSEPLKSKQSAWKNARAQGNIFLNTLVVVQDDTSKMPQVWNVYRGWKTNKTDWQIEPVYVPGKNKKKVLSPKVR